jgi:hypothetical protein
VFATSSAHSETVQLPPQQSPIDYASAELQTVKCAVEFSPNEPTHAHTLRIDYSRHAALCVSEVKSFSSWGFHPLQRELNCSALPMYAHLLLTNTAPACIIAKLLSPMIVDLSLFGTSVIERLVTNYCFFTPHHATWLMRLTSLPSVPETPCSNVDRDTDYLDTLCVALITVPPHKWLDTTSHSQ